MWLVVVYQATVQSEPQKYDMRALVNHELTLKGFSQFGASVPLFADRGSLML